ncbi:MAG TPA: nuclear transport factor 2 family protein [Thermoanaerobaculia bacterium]|nr:nuclear transport factor 2 family protein [Thermoanaerobaculia bacterium]
MSEHVATVQSLYEAFGRGDVPAILEQLSDDVRWDEWASNEAQSAGVPWMHPRVGKEGALEFFSVVGAFQFHEFQVRSLMAGGNQVVAEVIVDATVPTGARFRDEELHLWTFDESGKVARFRHYIDTAKHIAAARG